MDEYKQALDTVSYRDSEAFYAVQEQYRSEKYRIYDLGIFDLMLGGVIFLATIMQCTRILAAPRIVIVLLAIIVPLLSGSGQVVGLELSAQRDTFPSWADTLAIPFVGVIFYCFFSLLFSLCHLGYLQDCRGDSISLTKCPSKWLAGLIVLNLIFMVSSAFDGAWWEVFPSVLWLYYFASIGSRLHWGA